MTATEIKWLPQSYSGCCYTPKVGTVCVLRLQHWISPFEKGKTSGHHDTICTISRQKSLISTRISSMKSNYYQVPSNTGQNKNHVLTLKLVCEELCKQHILLIYFEQFHLLGSHSKSLVSLKFIFYSDDCVDDTTVTEQMCGTGNIFLANSHHSVKVLFSCFCNPCDHFLLL